MSNIKGKVVAITGPSSGIGESTARLLAAKGAHVVLGARRIDRLEALAETIVAGGGSVRMRALEVVSRQDTQAFIDYAKEQFGRVDVMVNNAGVMPVCTENLIRVDDVMESPKLAE